MSNINATSSSIALTDAPSHVRWITNVRQHATNNVIKSVLTPVAGKIAQRLAHLAKSLVPGIVLISVVMYPAARSVHESHATGGVIRIWHAVINVHLFVVKTVRSKSVRCVLPTSFKKKL